jgi:hypothetical protein
MNKLNKLLVVILSSLFVSAQAFAGELAVTGSANASYAINGGDSNSTGLGISNELKFAASGELDDGFTWSYFMELDGNDGGAHDNDDSQIKIGMGSLGHLSINDSEGGLSTETGVGTGALGVGDDFANTQAMIGNDIDISGYGNIEYATAADVLPLGTSLKVAYAPNTSDTDNNSYKSTGGINAQGTDGDSAYAYQIKMAPIDGLSIGADYITHENTSGVVIQDKEAGGFYAAYAMGNFKVGYGERYYATPLSARLSAGAHSYELQQVGIEFAVNDALSISYMEEDSTAKSYGAAVDAAAGASPFTRTETTFTSDYIQAAYDIGGATIGIANVDSTNSGYTVGNDESLTIISLALAF